MMYEDQAFVDEEMEPDPGRNLITNGIIGCRIAVHRELGPGQLESVYGKAMAIEMEFRGIHFQQQWPVLLTYRGQVVGEVRLDFLVEQQVILELKAVEQIAPAHKVQMVSYLRMTKLKLGLIMNFNVSRLVDGIKRFAN